MERLDEFQEGAMSTSIWKEKYNIIYTALGWPVKQERWQAR